MKEAPGSTSALETVTMLFPASRSLTVPLSARGTPLHFSNTQKTSFWQIYSVQTISHPQAGFGNENPIRQTFTVWLPHPVPDFFVLFLLAFLFLISSLISPLVNSFSLLLSFFFSVFLPFTHRYLFVLRTFEVALTGMKRNQTHFLVCVYINESFMCCVYGGTW